MKLSSNFWRRLTRLSALAVLLNFSPLARAAAPATPAQAPAAVSDNIYNYLELLRSDFNSAKVGIINKIMKLSAAEADKFWPVYREYEQAHADQAVNRAEFIAEFVQTHRDGSFDEKRAKAMAKRWFKLQRTRLDLLEKYHGKIERALSAVHAGQFLQIENQLMLFIDLTIAAEMPLVGEQ